MFLLLLFIEILVAGHLQQVILKNRHALFAAGESLVSGKRALARASKGLAYALPTYDMLTQIVNCIQPASFSAF